ncbi:Camp-Specific 3',5'-Cyclic Phosphodiesterase 4A [Manis pentadactyla]|nr:Camp-Specific 3',5'-Cyclic Phosphodiesterase 4A [Manis pentadactyla]
MLEEPLLKMQERESHHPSAWPCLNRGKWAPKLPSLPRFHIMVDGGRESQATLPLEQKSSSKCLFYSRKLCGPIAASTIFLQSCLFT